MDNMYKEFKKEIPLNDGRTITISTGKLAKQTDGSVVVRLGDTMLLATVVGAKEAKENVDFMPLSVEYQEKFASVGRFPGGFLKREGKPSDHEVLTARLVDRALRPLFPADFHAEVFVTVQLISADKNLMPGALAGLAASAALTISSIPFNGPISEVRVVRTNGKLIVNPTNEQADKAEIDLIIGGTKDYILMVEGEMEEVSEAEMLEAIQFGHQQIALQCIAQLEFAAEIGAPAKREYNHEISNEELKARIENELTEKVEALVRAQLPKQERYEKYTEIKDNFIATFEEEPDADTMVLIHRYYHDVQKNVVRNLILNEGIRIDGRKTNEIRPIWCEIDYLPSAHGSAIFTRGETQSLTTVTLGTKLDEKIIDDVLGQGRDKFLLHYNFPPFSTGDAKSSRGVSRREIGHGNLAHRALKRMIPTGEDNPYTVRVVSDILESNGSSSMATVCAGTLALMDSGIKLKKPVSGIAMGLITDEATGKYAVLSDILGDEDHLGDMDFKVTGTHDGITACQMDIKTGGLTFEIMKNALEQARVGRLHILGILEATISEPRAEYKPHAPRIERITIAKEMIGAIIGPGGKIIQQIQAESQSIIAIEEVDGRGIITISAINKSSIDAALEKINGIIAIPEVGKVYKGKVKSIVPFGAFVEILPGKDGLLHISEIEWKRVNAVEDVLKEGEVIEVKLIEIDKSSGKLKLSRKVLLNRPQRS